MSLARSFVCAWPIAEVVKQSAISMANVNVKLLFISTPPSASELCNHHGQLAAALGKVGKARAFVNPKMASVFSPPVAELYRPRLSHQSWEEKRK
jgi:hypothetical protein